uniref:Uncharacterized protein n=1 Tax=Cyclopterus lumpus TaxID=8103 RepID=A0A8C2Z5A2_CYCLU
MGNCLDWPLRTVGLFSPYQESIVSMTQNCALVSNIRFETCVFLSKGMATCRQAVRNVRDDG